MGIKGFRCYAFIKVTLGITFILLSFYSTAQQENGSQDSTQVVKSDSLVHPEKPVKKWIGGVYLEAVVEGIPGLGKRNFSQQFGIGLKYKSLTLGIYQNVALGTTTRTLIFPNNFDLRHSYGGVYLGALLINYGPLLAGIRINYGHGDMVWEHAENGDDLLRDTFHLIKPEVRIGYQPVSFFNVFVMGGYRQIFDLDLTGVDQGDFSGVTFALGIQLGYFNE